METARHTWSNGVALSLATISECSGEISQKEIQRTHPLANLEQLVQLCRFAGEGPIEHNRNVFQVPATSSQLFSNVSFSLFQFRRAPRTGRVDWDKPQPRRPKS